MTEFYCKACCKLRPLAGMVIRATANGQTKKVCASCVIKIKAASK